MALSGIEPTTSRSRVRRANHSATLKERKRLKGSDAYKHIDNNIKMACKTAKEEWLNSKCDEIELLSQKKDLTAMLQKIKSFQQKQTVTASCIKDKDGGILFETEKIVLRWTEYVKELFSDQRCANLIQEHLQGPEILMNEVEKCLKDMKYGKAAGIDNISCEMLKALGDFGIDTLTKLCNKMHHTAYIPEDLKTSFFLLLPKKPRATDRTISLMCHVLKLLLTVIHKRIAQKIDSEISEMQAGFRKARGTREAICSLKILAEKHIEMQKDIYACFIDYSKAFDSVKHEKLIQAMRKTDIDPNDIALISRLYWTQKTKVRVGKELSDEVDIKKGVRQGCVL
ncbi:RNA-directed DNA polymerase from mobile element jockey-like [Elysia marginata]|uniref:RNA-directed DNA polymerase from mobile element jockey-like n=1 Tax=Elysia marginata TaxID=1093978 RepID=A0AAV4IPU8_9GAST|nr:RNA-directed DNA polymerase from mobile element jockey-like [Elysia marginata]